MAANIFELSVIFSFVIDWFYVHCQFIIMVISTVILKFVININVVSFKKI